MRKKIKLLSNAPVVHYEDDHLCEGQEELTQVRDSVISVIHTREVDHVHSINHPLKIVQERDCGTLDSCGTYRDLQEKQIMMYVYKQINFQCYIIIENVKIFIIIPQC